MAMLEAVLGLTLAPDHLLIDAMRLDHPCRQTKLIYGDSLSLSIAAASVVAKVHRDALMRELDAVHPGYGLASHKGYGTPKHRRAVLEIGAGAVHRGSFAPVRVVEPDAAGGGAVVGGGLVWWAGVVGAARGRRCWWGLRMRQVG